jgi:hypothetical protein
VKGILACSSHQAGVTPRTFLHGIGAALALPLLDAMVPALTALAQTAANPVRRLGFVYIPMGMNAAAWTPIVEGQITELSPTLTPLMPFLDQITVMTNLELRNAYTTGNHASANCAFLSCAKAKRTEGTDYQLGTTVDQIAAQSIGRGPPIPSLEVGTDLIAQVGNCDNGYARAPEQSVMVVADHPVAHRGRSSRGLRASVRRRRQAGNAARRTAQERQHSRLDDGRPGAFDGSSGRATDPS